MSMMQRPAKAGELTKTEIEKQQLRWQRVLKKGCPKGCFLEIRVENEEKPR